MKNQTKTLKRWKISMLGIVVAIVVVTFACSEEFDQDIKKMGDEFHQISFNELPENMKQHLNEKNGELTFMKGILTIAEGEDYVSKLSQVEQIDTKLIHYMTVNIISINETELILALKNSAKTFDMVVEKTTNDDDVFSIVEEQPQYPGGMTAFYQYVSENLKYPAEAKRLGIEGRVFIQFTVDTDGTVYDVKPVKGIGGGCDEEAARIIAMAPAFSPGKQKGIPVKVKMVLPVQFLLSQKAASSDAKQNNVELITEIIDN